MNQQENDTLKVFLNKIEGLKPQIEGIYFYGSRARGGGQPNSDYDLLLILPQKKQEITSKIYAAAVDTYIDTGADISPKIIDKNSFDHMIKLSYPFAENVLKEGIKIG